MAKKATKKMPEIKPADMKETVIAAAFTLARQLGWAHVTMADIAFESGCSLAELYDRFDDKGDILAAYERGVTRRMLAGAAGDPGADPRDTLFDLFMDRFEILNEERAALLSVFESFRRNPAEGVHMLPNMTRTMGWMLEAAGLETSGWRGAARIVGLSGVAVAALRAWMDDDSPDLAKTMAAVDKNLGRAQDWAGRFNL